MELKQGIPLTECLGVVQANTVRILLYLKWEEGKEKEKLPSRNGGKEMIRKGSEGRLNLSYEMLKSHATKDSYSTKGTVITPQLNEKERKKGDEML